MTTGEKIHSLRKERGLTLEQLGAAVGVGKATVSKWENGIIRNITRECLAGIAEKLGVSEAYLIDEEGNEETDAILKDPDVRLLARAGGRMTPEQRTKTLEMLRVLYPELFEDA